MAEDTRPERAVRLPHELLERAAALIPKLQATPWGDALRWNETAVTRLALSRGLAVLEEELAEVEQTQLLGMIGKGKAAATLPASPKRKRVSDGR